MNVLTIGAGVIAAVLLVPAAVFCAQCVASLLPRRRRSHTWGRPTVAVLIPAHNEEAGLAATLSALRVQLRSGDVALVVADNCTDATADIARASGAEVLERQDSLRRGKGFALAAGVAALAARSFDVLVVLDADCHIEPGALDALASQAAATARPAQAIYLMETPANATPRDRVSAWAFMVKNRVRPLGLDRFGLPCLLTGTGMAFPRAAIEQAKLATGNIVEDMQLGLDLALAGSAPRLCAEAQVTGRLPQEGGTALTQRRRWEHGHLHTILCQAPRLLCLGVLRFKPGAVALAVDLLVPPLSLLVVLLLGAAALMASIATITDDSAQWTIAFALQAGLLAVIGSVFLAWIKFGRQILGAVGAIAVAGYVVWKIPLYVMFLVRPEKKWIRTARAAALSKPANSSAA